MAELNPQALEAYTPFQGPIPGQSLTNSEDEKQPWEQPPRTTNIKEARELMFLEILKEENLTAIVNLLDEGMTIAKLTEMLLFIGYTKGQFNPDMMLLLLEPTMYMLLAVAEGVGIDPRLDDEDDDLEAELTEEDNEEELEFLKIREADLRNPKALEKLQEKLERTPIPQEIQEQVEAVDFSAIKESLLAKPSKEENTNESLLQRK